VDDRHQNGKVKKLSGEAQGCDLQLKGVENPVEKEEDGALSASSGRTCDLGALKVKIATISSGAKSFELEKRRWGRKRHGNLHLEERALRKKRQWPVRHAYQKQTTVPRIYPIVQRVSNRAFCKERE